MGKIQVLDQSVSNKIAAGEVVERPASVAKELLENALDAGATHITVEIKNGGITYIRVSDNGCGMSREDVPVALLRHATSKIAGAEDLDAISTLGFRGEALSSICAVSKLEIYTRTAEEETGTHLLATDGHVLECDEAGCPTGTTVVVRDLFMNVPARMKFLRKNYTEAGYITDIVNRLALAHAEVSFRLITDGKETLFTTGDSDLLGCIYAIYGKDMKNNMRPASYSDGGVTVEGFCATGASARPNRSMQSFFVNGRYIKSPLLTRAVEEGYKNELVSGRFPSCVLLITLPPSLVDINVHPTKLEAKFANEKAVYHCVYWATKNALYQKTEVSAVTLAAEKEPQAAENEKTSEAAAAKRAIEKAAPIAAKASMREAALWPQRETKEEKAPFVWRGLTDKTEPRQEAVRFEIGHKTANETAAQTKPRPVELTQKQEAAAFVQPQTETQSVEPMTVQTEAQAVAMPAKPMPQTNETVPAAPPKPEAPTYRICGQVIHTYIIVEKDNEMLMIDQHAAHERLRYEELLKQYEGRSVHAQMLLLPVTIRLTATEMALFTEYQSMLADMGFEAELFGEKDVILRGAPEALDEQMLSSLFLEVLGHLGDKKKDARSERAQRALYTIACKSAVKAGKELTEAETRTLLDAVFALGPVNTCPHGRPITVALTRGFIEKQFKRIV